jgi:serine/threonine protein kinase/WD40 repeat protein
MTYPRWQQLKDLFAAAVPLPAAEREAFLQGHGADDELVQEVLTLLAAQQSNAPSDLGSTVDRSDDVPPHSEGPGTRIGPYTLREPIGEGGFGTVYAAEQEAPIRRRVALKIVKPGMDSRQVLARFEQERQALALMDHPNIARVFDGGSTPSGRPFFVMELVQGEPITDYCDHERLTTTERLVLFADVVRAVQHAHQKGVIHRDLKPSNVLVTVVDGRPIPKVIDFGIAKATQGRLTDRTLFTEHKQTLGTPLYMSPEQAHLSGVDVDTRSDVYSLGVLLYELLTGTTPFSRDELFRAGEAEMYRVLREVEPQRPSTRIATLGRIGATTAERRRVERRQLGSLLRGDLDWIVMKCLEKERARRYGNASDLVRDVERHLAGEAVSAVPPSLGYRVRKFVRRHRARVAAAVAVGLVAAAGLLAFVWSEQRRATDAQEAAAAREFDAYVARIQAADAALANDDVRTVRQNLEACPEHLRHWEWHYLDAASERSEFILAGHEGPVRFVAYDQKGEQLVTASDDGTARLWDPRTGKACGVLNHGGAGVRKAQFHPDGRWVATATAAGEVAVWDVVNLAKVATLVAARNERVDSDFAWSPDGRLAATVVLDGPTNLWECGAWQQGRVLEASSLHNRVLFAPASPRVLTWSPLHAPTLWDSASGELVAKLMGLNSMVARVRVDAACCFAEGAGGLNLQWKLQDGTEVGRHQGDQGEGIDDDGGWFRWGPDGEVWVGINGDMGGETRTLLGHRARLSFGTFLDYPHMLTASRDATGRMWKRRYDDARESALFLGHTAPITHAAVRPDEQQFATAAEDHTCRLWNLQHTWEQRRSLPMPGSLFGIAFSPDGMHVLTRSSHECQIHDLTTAQPTGSIQPGPVLGYAAWCSDAAFACGPSLGFHDAAGKSLLTTTHGDPNWPHLQDAIASRSHLLLRTQNHFELFHVASGSRIDLGELACADLDPTSPRFVIARKDRTIEVRSLDHDTILCRIPGQPRDVTALRFRPDGQQFLVATTEALEVFATDTGTSVASLPAGAHRDPIWSRDGTHIASWSTDGIQVFDARNGERLCGVKPATIGATPEDCLFGRKRRFDLSPDGARLLVCWADDQATPSLYETKSGRELLRLRGRAAAAGMQGTFSPDGRTIAVCSYGDDVTLWDSRRMSERLAAIRPLLMQQGRDLEAAGAAAQHRARAERLAKARTSQDTLAAICSQKASAEQQTELLTLLRAALADAPGDFTIQQHLAVAAYQGGAYADCERLLAELDKAPGRDQDHCGKPVELSFLTMAQSRLGKRDAALANLTLLGDYDPDNLAYAAFGLTCHELQRQARAVFLECFPDAKLPEARK